MPKAKAAALGELKPGARVGTSSIRRRALLAQLRRDLHVEPVRGNVDTRLRRLDSGSFDALLLACAGLDRLGFGARIGQRIDAGVLVPAPGQGALAVEFLAARQDVGRLVAAEVDADVERCIRAERQLTRRLGADCATPLGAHCASDGAALRMVAALADAEGARLLRVELAGAEPIALGDAAAKRLDAFGRKRAARHLMRVWVTRTEPGATRLARTLAEHGFAVFKAPVLGIEPSGAPPPAGRFNLVLFVSENAVAEAARSGLRNASWRLDPVVAIGAPAQAALLRLGIEPFLPWQADAASVVEALPSPPKRTLVVKGEGGRDVVQRWLRAGGCAVFDWNVYRRVSAAPVIAGERIDAVVAASADGLRRIERLWFAQRRAAVVPLLVPSQRVAELAKAAGFENVFVTSGAGSSAIVETLDVLRGEGSGKTGEERPEAVEERGGQEANG